MLNKIMLIGNVGTDPEMRYTPNGNPVTTFRFAVGHRYTDSGGERKEETEWFSVVCWNQLAEQTNQYLSKGQRAFVEGRLKSNTWTAQDGTQRFGMEIVANRVLFLDRPSDKGDAEPVAAGAGAAADEREGDLPW